MLKHGGNEVQLAMHRRIFWHLAYRVCSSALQAGLLLGDPHPDPQEGWQLALHQLQNNCLAEYGSQGIC